MDSTLKPTPKHNSILPEFLVPYLFVRVYHLYESLICVYESLICVNHILLCVYDVCETFCNDVCSTCLWSLSLPLARPLHLASLSLSPPHAHTVPPLLSVVGIYICTFTYIYICRCRCRYIYTYTYMYKYINIHIYIYPYM